MTITATVVADSINSRGARLTTMVLTYPRFIHAEFMTHRVFSRNASSSRAIPVEKMLAAVKDNPVIPIHWGANQPGMQARAELDDTIQDLQGPGYRDTTARGKAKMEWLSSLSFNIERVKTLVGLGLHKQIANRLLEPHGHITVVATATEFPNFYSLRCHPDAEPHMQALAEAMLAAHNASTPKYLEPDEWHLPFVTDEERKTLPIDAQLRASVARCARVSYLNHDKTEPDLVKDSELYDKLLASGHCSPFEHQARPPIWMKNEYKIDGELQPKFMSNLRDWVQLRKLLVGENRTEFSRYVKPDLDICRSLRYNDPNL